VEKKIHTRTQKNTFCTIHVNGTIHNGKKIPISLFGMLFQLLCFFETEKKPMLTPQNDINEECSMYLAKINTAIHDRL